MRLSLRVHEVISARWSPDSCVSAGDLRIDRDRIREALLQDNRLASVDLELVQVGESCRMLPVFDVIEPRVKIEPKGVDFPGVLGPVQSVGYGVTRVLRGLAVTALDTDVDPGRLVPGRLPVIDMAGSPVEGHASSATSRYASLSHVVLIPRFADGLSRTEHLAALRLASLRAAARLAEMVQQSEPDIVEEYELSPCSALLPRVAYVYQMHSHQRPTLPGEPMLYGDNCRFLLPTLLHPNELLDGAIVTPYQQSAVETYAIQNHAVILDLYRRHGRELNFVGVVVDVANQLPEEKQRATIVASNLLHEVLRADGAVYTKAPGGAANVDMAVVAASAEDLGVRSSLLVSESSVDEHGDAFMLFNTPALDAVVSVESGPGRELPAVERVVAPSAALAERYQGIMPARAFNNVGIKDYLGGGRVAALEY